MSVPQAAWATETAVARARELWDAGLSATRIGRWVGASKSAIIGYARRHGWPPRPAPIGRPKPPRADVPTPARRPKRDPAALRVTCKPEPLAVPSPPHRRCQWPFGEPKTRGFRFCEATPVVEGRPYCPAHCEIAYHRPPRWAYAPEAVA